MDLRERTVLMEDESSKRWMWKASGACLFAVLCVGGIRLGFWYWTAHSDLMMQLGQTEALINHSTAEKTGAGTGSLNASAQTLHPLPFIGEAQLATEEVFGDTLTESRGPNKAAIHLVGDYDDEEGMKDEVKWFDNIGTSFHQGGLQLVDNRIVIRKTGLYFVYSQVTFRIRYDEDMAEVENHLTPLIHRIMIKSTVYDKDVVMMQAIRSLCKSADGRFHDTLYLGSQFYLHKDDTLSTRTTHLSDVESWGNFFGVFAL